MTTKTSDKVAGREVSPEHAAGDKIATEAPTDQYGNTPDWDLERFPEGSPAPEGEQTLPSGQGGKTPHDGTSYQDQFPPNPEPSDTAKAWGEYLDALDRGEDVEPPLPTADTESTHQSDSSPKAKSATAKDTTP